MSWENTVEAVAAGIGASVTVAALARSWFRSAVKAVVKESVEPVIRRQERQDLNLRRIERKLDGTWNGGP